MDAIVPTALWHELFGDRPKPRTEFPWDTENVERLKQMIADKMSFSEIGASLGCSRNSCIGKAHRLGLSIPRPPGQQYVKREPKPRADHWTGFPKRKSPDRKPPMIVAQPQDGKVVPLNVSFEDLQTGQCKYPYGNAVPYFYCGHPAEGDGSWCRSHRILCFTGLSRGWERPDQTYRFRKLSGKNPLTQADDFPTPEQLPEVA